MQQLFFIVTASFPVLYALAEISAIFLTGGRSLLKLQNQNLELQKTVLLSIYFIWKTQAALMLRSLTLAAV